jgi:serine O-acetyltransferase
MATRTESAASPARLPDDTATLRQARRPGAAWTTETAFLDALLAFMAECVDTTPLRRHATRIHRAGHHQGEVPSALAAEAAGLFATDLERFQISVTSPRALVHRLELAPNLVATLAYRLSHALYVSGEHGLPDIIATVARQLTGTELYYSARIGPGLKLIHGSGTVIGAGCRIGRSFTAYQGVTVGDKLGRQTGDRPILGDEIIASAGAKVLGPVRVGSKTVIAANAVVIRSLPERCVAAGAPAEPKRSNLSDEAYGEFLAAIRS